MLCLRRFPQAQKASALMMQILEVLVGWAPAGSWYGANELTLSKVLSGSQNSRTGFFRYWASPR